MSRVMLFLKQPFGLIRVLLLVTARFNQGYWTYKARIYLFFSSAFFNLQVGSTLATSYPRNSCDRTLLGSLLISFVFFFCIIMSPILPTMRHRAYQAYEDGPVWMGRFFVVQSAISVSPAKSVCGFACFLTFSDTDYHSACIVVAFSALN